MVRFTCPHCKRGIRVPPALLGRIISCPACDGKVQLPNPEPEPLPAIVTTEKKPPTENPSGIERKEWEYWIGALLGLFGVCCLLCVGLLPEDDQVYEPGYSPGERSYARAAKANPRPFEDLQFIPYDQWTAEEKRIQKEWADNDLETRIRPNVERMLREMQRK